MGSGRRALFQALKAGTSGRKRITLFDPSPYPVEFGGQAECKGPWPAGWEGLGRAARLLLLASSQALTEAGVGWDSVSAERAAVVVGTGMVEPLWVEEVVRAQVSGREPPPAPGAWGLPGALPCDLAPLVARAFGFQGPCLGTPVACSASAFALAAGLELIRQGRVDLVLAGGTESLNETAMAGFARLGALDPERCRPFDRERQGIMVGEGACMMVLESFASARRRGRRPLGVLAGYGLSSDSCHPVAPDPSGEGVALAMQRALADAGLGPDEVDFISAHGTGTPLNDRVETLAVRRALGGRAGAVALSATKSMLGHTGGAAGAFGAAAALLAVNAGWLSPTINYRHPDPDCDLECVANRARRIRVRAALANALAFGGSNVCLAFRPWNRTHWSGTG
ncbi:MAG: beta-ketoacyl-[acyl-carrier-protein] synthase family protein [Acetobacteraceae bacterium]|nr:beta-ketoacyl-[acyl-carrier-protein] synthase family protein [Acetobacteraceae bacterium]